MSVISSGRYVRAGVTPPARPMLRPKSGTGRGLDQVRHADVADGGAVPGDRDRGGQRRLGADALEHRVAPPVSVMTSSTARRRGRARVGGAEPAGQLQPLLVVADHGDALGAEPAGGEHRAQPDRAVADDHDPVAELDAGRQGRVVAGGQHVAERQQQLWRGVPQRGRHDDQGAVRVRDPQRLALRPVVARARRRRRRPRRTWQADRQYSQVPSDQVNGEITRSPAGPCGRRGRRR